MPTRFHRCTLPIALAPQQPFGPFGCSFPKAIGSCDGKGKATPKVNGGGRSCKGEAELTWRECVLHPVNVPGMGADVLGRLHGSQMITRGCSFTASP